MFIIFVDRPFYPCVEEHCKTEEEAIKRAEEIYKEENDKHAHEDGTIIVAEVKKEIKFKSYH